MLKVDGNPFQSTSTCDVSKVNGDSPEQCRGILLCNTLLQMTLLRVVTAFALMGASSSCGRLTDSSPVHPGSKNTCRDWWDPSINQALAGEGLVLPLPRSW